jgi:hypothetical protein
MPEDDSALVTALNISTTTIALPFSMGEAAVQIVGAGGTDLLGKLCKNIGAAFGLVNFGTIALDAYLKTRDGVFSEDDRIDVGLDLIKTGAITGAGLLFGGPMAIGVLTFLAVSDLVIDSVGGYDWIEDWIKDVRRAYDDQALEIQAIERTNALINYVSSTAAEFLDINSPNSIYLMEPGSESLERALFQILEASFYVDNHAKRSEMINSVKEYLDTTEGNGYYYDDVRKEAQMLESIPSSMDLDSRIIFAANNSDFKTNPLAPAYSRLYSMSVSLEKKFDEPDPKDPSNPDNYGDMPNRYFDPLMIDLDRNGTVNTTDKKRYFDLNADGIIEQTSWAAPGEGILVLDRDGDGRITSGRELFGDRTVMSNGKVATSGFQALSDLDSNRDGIIDSNDTMFSELRVWADKDEDGVFGDEELFTLEEMGIKSINLRNCY